jgi:hypothetical protein
MKRFPVRCGRYRGAIALLALSLLTGCRHPVGEVSGQVLYNDKPLPGGVVTFVPTLAGHNAAFARLDEEGRYQVTVAAGDVQMSVDNRDLQTTKPVEFPPPPGAKIPAGTKGEPVASPSAPEKLPGKYVEIPERYYRAESSGLTMTVQPGPQTYTIKLK